MNKVVSAILGMAFLCVALWAAAGPVLPDVYIEERLDGPPIAGVPTGGVIKSWVSGIKLKQINPSGEEVFIFRADLGKMYMVNSTRRAYLEMPLTQVRQMTERSLDIYIPRINGVPTIPDEIYKKTGRTKKIGQWNVYEVEVVPGQSGPGMSSKTTMWVTKETGFDHAFMVRLFKITMGEQVSPDLQKLFDKMTALDGYPVQTITTTTFQNQTYTSTKTLVKIERRDNMPANLFEVPTGYTKIEPPTPGSAKP